MSVELHQQRIWTLDDLDHAHHIEGEIWMGELIPVSPARRYHNIIAARLFALFDLYCENHRDLCAGADNEGFVLQASPMVFFSPDACIYRLREHIGDGWMHFAPELAVEVLSPANSKPEIASKKAWYFRAGAEQVWLVDPDKKTIEIHYKTDQEQLASGPAILKCSGIVDGLEVDLAKVFDDSKYR